MRQKYVHIAVAVVLSACFAVKSVEAKGGKAFNLIVNVLPLATHQAIGAGFTFGGKSSFVFGPKAFVDYGGTQAGSWAAGLQMLIYLNGYRHVNSVVFGVEGDYWRESSGRTGLYASLNFGPTWFLGDHLNLSVLGRFGYGVGLSGAAAAPAAATAFPSSPIIAGLGGLVEGSVGIAF